MLSCESSCPLVLLESVASFIQEKWMEDGMSAKKLKDTVALLVKNGLLSVQDGEVRLTSVGERLSVLCLKEVRLDYPCVEAFIQEGYLQKLEAPTAAMPVTPATPATQAAASTVQNTPHSTAQSTTLGTDVVLPSIRWPLAPPPPSFVMGDWQQMEEEEPAPPPPPRNPVTIAEAEAWEVLLLLDNREVRTKKDRDFLKNQLVQAGVECDVRNLSLGDMQWVLRRPRDGEEVMLNVLVERKNVRDLAMSIMDGRFNEQQFRLLHCGVRRVVYLVEGALRSQDVMPPDSLQTAIMMTVVHRGIYVYQSTSIDDTVVFLKELTDVVKGEVERFFATGDETCLHPQRMAYEAFQEQFAKTKGSKLKHLWCKQLRQVILRRKCDR